MCVEHLILDSNATASELTLETRVAALVQVADTVKSATVEQQLEALNLLGRYAGLDEELEG